MELKGTARTIDKLNYKKESEGKLSEKDEDFINNHKRYNKGEEVKTPATGGGDRMEGHQNSFVVVEDGDEYNIIKEATRGEVNVRYVQNRNDDGTFAQDDRSEAHETERKEYKNAKFEFEFNGKEYFGASGMVQFVNDFTHLNQKELLKLSKENPDKFSIAARLAIENFTFEAQKIDDPSALKIIKNSYKNYKGITEGETYTINVFRNMNRSNILGLMKNAKEKEEKLKPEVVAKINSIVKENRKERYDKIMNSVRESQGVEEGKKDKVAKTLEKYRDQLETLGYDVESLIGKSRNQIAEEKAVQREEKQKAKEEKQVQEDVAAETRREEIKQVAETNKERVAQTDKWADELSQNNSKRNQLFNEISTNPNAKEVYKDFGLAGKDIDNLSDKDQKRLSEKYGIDFSSTRDVNFKRDAQNKVLSVYDKELRNKSNPEEPQENKLQEQEKAVEKKEPDTKELSYEQKANEVVNTSGWESEYKNALNNDEVKRQLKLLINGEGGDTKERFELAKDLGVKLSDFIGKSDEEKEANRSNLLKNKDFAKELTKRYLINKYRTQEFDKNNKEKNNKEILETMGLNKEDLDKEDR